MSKQDKGTGKVHQLHADKATKIEPLDGWKAQTKYGTLRLGCDKDPNKDTYCVRLQDVHTWFLRDGAPASTVNWKMFTPLLDAAREACDGALDAAGELAACKLLGSLHLLRANDWPVQIFCGRVKCEWSKEKNECQNMQRIKARPLFSGADFEDTWVERYVPFLTFMQSDDVKFFRSNFPGLGHHRFEDGTPAGLIYGMAEGVVRAWRGPVDAATDPVLMAGIKKDRAEEDEYRIEWPSDEVLSLALERVAVPIAIAHELWGWGRVVAAQAETQAAPAMEASMEDSGKKGRYDWEGDPKLYAKLVSDYGQAKGSEGAKREALAKEWGLSPASIKKQLPIARAAVEAAAKSPFNATAVGRLTG